MTSPIDTQRLADFSANALNLLASENKQLIIIEEGGEHQISDLESTLRQ